MTDKERDLLTKLAVDSALAGVAEGKRLERERIVKLLENFIEVTSDFRGMAFYRMGVLDSIATIKGDEQ